MAKLTFLGHACFLLEDNDRETLLFDPFLSGNPVAAAEPGDIKTG
ncbi:MAG: MBL fold metallo-hydrolase, partial [Dethiobacteria bacterium]